MAEPRSPTRRIGTVVVLDDEPEMAHTLAQLVTQLGYQTKTAVNSSHAWELLEQQSAQLLLSDFQMPDVSGVDFCIQVKNRWPEMVTVLVTGHSEKGMAIASLRAGIFDIQEKPVSRDTISQLLERVEQHLDKQDEAERAALKTLRADFVSETEAHLADADTLVLQLENKSPQFKEITQELFRRVHTMKGSAGFLAETHPIAAAAQHLEMVLKALRDEIFAPSEEIVDAILGTLDYCQQALDQLKNNQPVAEADVLLCQRLDGFLTQTSSKKAETSDGIIWCTEPPEAEPAAASHTALSHSDHKGAAGGHDEKSITVQNEKLDRLMDHCGAFVVLCNDLRNTLGTDQLSISELKRSMESFSKELNARVNGLQEEVLQIRKVPFRRVTHALPRLVRSVSHELQKHIELHLSGDAVELDKTVAAALSTALVHMVRNSCDHGIETPEARRAQKKPETGTLSLSATTAGGVIQIVLEDDGHGIDSERLVHKAMERGLLMESEAKKMSEQEKLDLIFIPGLSTAEKISEISGQGVGMDVVRTAIAAVNGIVMVSSTVGTGSRFTLSIPEPKSVAIEKLMVIKNGNHHFGASLDAVVHVLPLNPERIVEPRRNPYRVMVENEVVPVVDYSGRAATSHTTNGRGEGAVLLLMESRKGRVALLADAIEEIISAVVRPKPADCPPIPACRGVALLPSDRLAFVVEPEQLDDALGIVGGTMNPACEPYTAV